MSSASIRARSYKLSMLTASSEQSFMNIYMSLIKQMNNKGERNFPCFT